MLTPVKDVNEAGGAVRSPVADVYTQILADLGDAKHLITATATDHAGHPRTPWPR